ncbi:MAG: enoyl-CoA hydratase/isomerase family protein [Acidimicrobiia bacterium]|nr:enoyl-CoA hydratase/isomerase family protein [Acidimicrobiia bacterium]MDX2466584.1 enoyl-CoA hydratase/isomerase family protein [Acidimicrobiia bacterium]
MKSLIKTSRSSAVATVVLNRPERHNSLIPALLRELLDSIETVGNDRAIRAVVLAAEGKSFSTGGDVKAFFAAGDDLADYAAETVGLLNDIIMAMIRLPQPIIAAVHGMVTGGSLGLLLGSDVVLMAPEATITPWYPVAGYSPDGGWTAILPNVIGSRRTAMTLLRNETITADDAVAWGIAADVVPAAGIRVRAEALAQEIAEMQPGSIVATKRLLNTDTSLVAAALEQERTAFVKQIVTPEARKGMAAFLGMLR